jgi:D-arabinose 1-dehydrogenase-like Zn-dependent alcohol dehydrogenase
MVVGHPQQRLTFTSIDIALRKFRIYGDSNSIPVNLKECLDFSLKRNAKSHVTYYRKWENIYKKVDLMQQAKVKGRVAIRFD